MLLTYVNLEALMPQLVDPAAAVDQVATPTRRPSPPAGASDRRTDQPRAAPAETTTAGPVLRRRLASVGGTESKSSRLAGQELAVARLVAAGAGDREIARELFIGIPTVKFHLTHIYSKLEISTREQIVACMHSD
jgi:DNA-binding CsgD family transcriptional regulator